jgi:xanthine dehydrogenase iron-sulfur cluster and FAD-binding subunit A
MLMSSTALLRRDPNPSRETIAKAIAGNLCRCTGYGAIIDAVALAAKIRSGAEPSGRDLPGAELPPPLPLPKERK